MIEKIEMSATFLFEKVLLFGDCLFQVYLDYWLNAWVLIPIAVLVFLFLSFLSKCNFYYSPKSLWETLFMEFSLNIPGGHKRKIEFLKNNVFPDWSRTLKERESFYEVGEWTGKDFAEAYVNWDTNKLSKMCKIIEPWWNFWIVRPTFAFLVAIIVPFFVFTVIIFVLVYGVFILFSSKSNLS